MSEKGSPENQPRSQRQLVHVMRTVVLLSVLGLLWCIVAAAGHKCPSSANGSLLADRDQHFDNGNLERLKQEARKDDYRQQRLQLRALIETDPTRQRPQRRRMGPFEVTHVQPSEFERNPGY